MYVEADHFGFFNLRHNSQNLCRNTTNSFLSPPLGTYWGQFDEISKYNIHLNIVERLWAAWYAYLQNDVLATGIMSFVMHEIVYFGRALPWVFIDRIHCFNKYKIQNVLLSHYNYPRCWWSLLKIQQQKIPTVQEQWSCTKLVLLSHFTVELPQIWYEPSRSFGRIQSFSKTVLGYFIQWPNISALQPRYLFHLS